MAKPKKPQGKTLHKELVFQNAEESALLFVFDQKKQQQNKPNSEEWEEYPSLMPERSP